MASSLRILLKGSEVIAPDVPIEPSDALAMLEGICSSERPDLIVGHSLGGFWAQKLRGFRKVLVNPDFHTVNCPTLLMCYYLISVSGQRCLFKQNRPRCRIQGDIR